MATPDPSKFTTSAQIFSTNHTLPQIRSIHKALHADIEDKASRLRAQVGGSYRELLGTADTIVQMRSDNDAVQELLGKMGWRCGRTVVSSKVSGLGKFVGKNERVDVAEAGRRKLLDGCFLVVSRILKGRGQLPEGATTGDRLLLAAKVWVVSRLLVKSLGDKIVVEGEKHVLEEAKKTLDSLRRRLRRAFEKILEKASENSDRDDILKALCAYSLVNSSGAKDALRQLLEIRSKATILALDVDESERVRITDDVIQSLKLYTRTLLDVQALVPAKLSAGLKALTKETLLDDPSLQELEGLRLDVCERWCSEEIQYFTPYIRHDDLEGSQAREILTSWSETGSEVVMDGLRKTLEKMTDFKAIMELRTQVLQLWIREGSKVKGIDPQDTLDEIREAINSRMLAVLESKVQKLHIVGSEIQASLEGWQEGVSGKVPGLWQEDGYEEALGRGAVPFIQEVATRVYGRSDSVSKALNCYSSWYHIIDDVKEVVESLKKQRWDNDYDEIEDEETIETRRKQLSKDDPKMLQDKLESSLDESFKALEDQLRVLWESNAEGENSVSIAMFFIRIVRDIRRQLPERDSIKGFGLSMVPEMQQKIAISIATPPVNSFIADFLPTREVISKPLWEGEPELPNQPSFEVFQCLQDLCLAMSDVGIDLWTPNTVKHMKGSISEQLCTAWMKELAGLELTEPANPDKKEDDEIKVEAREKDEAKDGEPVEESNEAEEAKEESNENDSKANEDEEPREEEATLSVPIFTAEDRRDLCTQWIFDVALYRLCIGNISGAGAESFSQLEDEVFKVSELGDKSRQRIEKAARAFWNRTNLLFGLLA